MRYVKKRDEAPVRSLHTPWQRNKIHPKGVVPNGNPDSTEVRVDLHKDKRSVFEGLVRPLMGSLYNTACWMLKDRDRAQDLLQETLLKAYRGFDRFETGTNFRAWIFQILRNAFIDAYHARRGEPECVPLEDLDEIIHPTMLNLETAGMETPEKIIARKLLAVDIQKALMALPEKYRTPIVLCDLEECSYKEAGRILGIPIGTVMSRLYRGRRLVQKQILEQGERATRPGEVRTDGL